MISIVQPLSSGNAIRLYLEPPAGAVKWRILKKGSDTIADENDSTAAIAYEGDDRVIVDYLYLQNGVLMFYRPFYQYADGSWVAGASASGTPAATYKDHSSDVLTVIRERLEAGMQVEVQRGNIQADIGYVPVYTAPPSLERDLRFPLITVQLENEIPEARAIGDDIVGDWFDAVGFDWTESEGWLARVSLAIVGWSLNSDERIEMRKAIRRLIIANSPVFDSLGFAEVTMTQQDVDAVNGEYNAPIYMVHSTFSCLAPVLVSQEIPAIREVITDIRSP